QRTNFTAFLFNLLNTPDLGKRRTARFVEAHSGGHFPSSQRIDVIPEFVVEVYFEAISLKRVAIQMPKFGPETHRGSLRSCVDHLAHRFDRAVPGTLFRRKLFSA